jgi:T-complex protein 1 subunit eta
LKTHKVVAGGGAIELELSAHLRSVARTIPGKQQLIVSAFAKALEVIIIIIIIIGVDMFLFLLV